MKTYNIHFSKESFDALNFTEINKAKSVLVQIFSGICDKDYIEDVIDYISKSIPNAVIIGATTDGEICNATVSTDKVVVSISTFKKTTLSSHTNTGINKENSYFYGEKLAHSLSKGNNLAYLHIINL